MSLIMYLRLAENKISDITILFSLTKLERLALDGNPISNSQKERLKEELPNCSIQFS